MKIVWLDKATFADEINIIYPQAKHEWIEYERTKENQLVERLQGARIAITNKVPFSAAMLDQLPELEMISIAATGYNVVDVDHCKKRGVTVCNARAYSAHSLSEHCMALILSLRRAIVGYRQDVIADKWREADQFCFHTHSMYELHGATLGIIGGGNLGSAVARLAEAFGMRVLFAGRKDQDVKLTDTHNARTYTPFDEVLAASDILSLHCPLTPDTKDLIATPEFNKMERKPLIINTARGGLVNEHDLIKALDNNLISGIGFDVTTTEPPQSDNPLMQIIDRPNVIVTPHVAWASVPAQTECWRQTIVNIDHFLQGTPTNVIV